MSTLTTSKRSDVRIGGAKAGAPAMRRSSVLEPGASMHDPAERNRVRPFLRRWLTAAMLLAASVLATLYISNAIAINDLMVSIASLEHDRDVARANNEKVRAELLKLMAVERVTSIAAGQLGMVQPVQPPLTLSPGTRDRLPLRDSTTVR
jgi:hypothetical protein